MGYHMSPIWYQSFQIVKFKNKIKLKKKKERDLWDSILIIERIQKIQMD